VWDVSFGCKTASNICQFYEIFSIGLYQPDMLIIKKNNKLPNMSEKFWTLFTEKYWMLFDRKNDIGDDKLQLITLLTKKSLF
jgi:hypothetical protein